MIALAPLNDAIPADVRAKIKILEDDLRAGRLVRILEDWTASREAGEGEISAVYLPNRRGSVKIRCFIDRLVAAIGNPPSWDAEP